MIETHDLHIESEADGHLATCSCGWEARRVCELKEVATEAWEDHCEQVFMEATGG